MDVWLYGRHRLQYRVLLMKLSTVIFGWLFFGSIGTFSLVWAVRCMPTMAAGGCAPDGRALRELVWFYWQHRERRGELTDDRALTRLADERFVSGTS
jgi:hypothetical protein